MIKEKTKIKTKIRSNIKKRTGALVFLSVLLLSGTVQAEEGEQSRIVLQRLRHMHQGNCQEGGPCYENAVRHCHQGNPGEGGICYALPVYHTHTGNEEGGGGCYREAVYHVHQGNEEEGGSCYRHVIYHQHEGSEETGGSCYLIPRFHTHDGNERNGGSCFQKPVYHSHTGNEKNGGDCFQKPVYHKHTGNKGNKGGCFQIPVYHVHDSTCNSPVYHRHTAACYETAECGMHYLGGLEIIRTENGYCYHHGETQIAYFRGDYRHDSCGAEKNRDSHSVCWTCQNMDKSHTYERLVCGKDERTIEGYTVICGYGEQSVAYWKTGCGKTENTIEGYSKTCEKDGNFIESYEKTCPKDDTAIDGYKKSCTKTEETIEGYQLSCEKKGDSIDCYKRNCGKNESSIEAYDLSCGKTEKTIEYYTLSCSKNEEEAYGEILLKNLNEDWTGENAVLQVSCHSEEGFLQLEENPYVWKGAGVAEEKGTQVSVGENGIYAVTVRLKNRDTEDREPTLSIEVRNIDRTPPVIKGTTSENEKNGKKKTLSVTAEDLQPDGTAGSGIDGEAYSFDGGKTWQTEDHTEIHQNGTIIIAVRDRCQNVARQSVEITGIDDTDTGDTEKNDTDRDDTDTDHTEREEKDKKEENTEPPGEEDNSPTEEQEPSKKEVIPIPPMEKPVVPKKENGLPKGKKQSGEPERKVKTSMPDQNRKKREYKKTVTEVRPEKILEKPEQKYEIETVKRKNAVEIAVKAAAFTLSGVALAAGLIYFIYLMFMSIRIYYWDGEENRHYAGSCLIRKKESGFELEIPDMILEQSCTGQYILRPGYLFLQCYKGKELLVMAKEKREAVWIDREIPFRVSLYA